MNFFDPSTLEGALTIGVVSGLISGAVIGFFSGKAYEKKTKSHIKQKGNGNVALQNSQVGRDLFVREK